MWHIQTMEYYSAVKKKQYFAICCDMMDLEGYGNEISQTEIGKHFMTLLIWVT